VAVALLVVDKFIEAGPPAPVDLPGIIAKNEGVQPSEVQVLAYEVSHGVPAVLYRFTDQPFRAPGGIGLNQPLKLSRLVHPVGRPWQWTEGGGFYGGQLKYGAAASLDLGSASGDTGTVINTMLFGAALPNVAEIQLTVHGQRYIRDLRQSDGYIILLPDKGVSPADVMDIRVLEADGHELPPPRGYGIDIGAPVSHS
jgi:hypothetical protein